MCVRLNPPLSTLNSSCNGTLEERFNFFEVDIYSGFHLYTLRNSTFENFNYSDFEFPNEIWFRKPDWEMGLKGAAFLLVVLLGVVGNALLLNIVLRNRSIYTPTNLLIANMAAADLVTLLIFPWIFFCMDCFQNYMLGEVGCRAQGFAECSLLLTGVINLVAVSYDRLTAIVKPLETRLTIHGTHIVIMFTWVTGALLGLPLIFLRIYRVREWMNFVEVYCTEETVVMPIYWYVVIIFVVWLPLAVMTICYIGLFIKLDRYEKRVQRFHPNTVFYKTKVARTIFIVLIVFVVCRVPFTALIFLRAEMQQGNDKINQVEDTYNLLWFISHYLITVNAALDPVIYGLTNETFRRAFRSTMLAKLFFGTSATASLPRLPRTPVKREESRHLGLENPDLNHWFVIPKQKKTATTDCYI